MTSINGTGGGVVTGRRQDESPGQTAWRQLSADEQAAVRKYFQATREQAAPADLRLRWGNRSENECFRTLVENGFQPSRLGFPDFWFLKDDKLVFVEIKPAPGTPLKRPQLEFHLLAAKHGILCYRWDPYTGFTPIGHNTDLGLLKWTPTGDNADWRRCLEKTTNGWRCRGRRDHGGEHRAWNSAGKTISWG